jgi:thiol-disulfide isomerase/thioredoxin
MDALQIQKTKPPDSIKNALILYYRPTCPACVSCMPTFEKVPESLKAAGIQDFSIYMVDTNTIDVSEAIGGQIQTVPKIIYVGSNGNVYVYPTTHRTVDKIVDFVKQSMSSTNTLNTNINAGSLTTNSLKKIDKNTGMFGSLQTMIEDLFFTPSKSSKSSSSSSRGLSGGLSGGFKSKSKSPQRQTKRLKKSFSKLKSKSNTKSRVKKYRKIRETKSRSRRRHRNRHSKKYR